MRTDTTDSFKAKHRRSKFLREMNRKWDRKRFKEELEGLHGGWFNRA